MNTGREEVVTGRLVTVAASGLSWETVGVLPTRVASVSRSETIGSRRASTDHGGHPSRA